MAERGLPGTGGGNLAQVVDLAGWSAMARLMASDGVVAFYPTDLECFADSTGLQVKVRPGVALVRGVLYWLDSLLTVPLAANSSGLSRRDLIAIRLDISAQTVKVVAVQGVPAASPTTPAETRTDTVWDVQLASVVVASGAATIAPANVDARSRLLPAPSVAGRGRLDSSAALTVASALTTTEAVVDVLRINDVYVQPGARIRLALSVQVAGTAGLQAVVRVRESIGRGLAASLASPVVGQFNRTVSSQGPTIGETVSGVVEYTTSATAGARSWVVTVEPSGGAGSVRLIGSAAAPGQLHVEEVTPTFIR